MRLSVADDRKQQLYKVLVLCVFALVLLLIRVPFELVSDDEVVAKTIKKETLWENFLLRWNYNGRIFTDVLANLFYRVPLFVWKLFDVLVYVRIAILLGRIFTKNSWQDIILVCALMLLYPVFYLCSAGYIATTTNYVYPVAGLVEITYHISCVRQRKRIPVAQYIVTLLSVLYVTNHDQSGMVLIGGLLLYLIYNIALKEGKAVIANTACWLAVSTLCYVSMFFIPGHIYRMNDTKEMEFWLPQYAEWTLGEKIYRGFATTCANFLFADVKLFELLALLLMIVGLLNQGALYKKVIAVIPFGVMILSDFIGERAFTVIYDYACKMPDLLPANETIAPLLVSIIAVGSIFYTAFTCVKNKESKWLITMLLLLAAGSRLMMGLSATIYASSFRTFTFFLYAVIICCLRLLQEIINKKNETIWHITLGAMIGLLIL